MWNQHGPAPIGEFINFFPGQKYTDISVLLESRVATVQELGMERVVKP